MTRRDKEKERKREREFPRGKFERLANGLSKLIYRKKKKKEKRGEKRREENRKSEAKIRLTWQSG